RNGFRVWNIESSQPLARNIPNALSLAPSSAARPLVALNEDGLRFIDLADSSVNAGPFLRGDTIAWHGWTKDGRLLVITRRGSEFRGHWCSLAGCVDSTAHSLSEDPGGTGLQIDPCGEIFGVHFLLQQTDKELALPQELGNFPRLCAVGDRLVALPATSSGEWLTFSSIVEFLRDRRHPWPYDTSERKIPGGAIAVEWTKDRRELSTLSANGLMLSWPATVSQPTEELVKLAPARERTQETWPEVDRRGEIVAVGVADHAGGGIWVYSRFPPRT